jgi:hypothetical protein
MKRIIMRMMPSSMIEKAQSCMEPKTMGVKIIKRTRMDLMTISIIALFGH